MNPPNLQLHTSIVKAMTSAILCYHTINPTISTLTKDELVQQIRGQIVHQIRGILFEFLRQVSSGTPQILGDTPISILDPENYLRSYIPFAVHVQNWLHAYHAYNKVHFVVAVNIYFGKHSYLVVNVNNTNYNYQTAHKCQP